MARHLRWIPRAIHSVRCPGDRDEAPTHRHGSSARNQRHGPSPVTRTNRKPSSVNDLRPLEQAAVLTALARRADAVGDAVRAEIERHLERVDPELVAGEVRFDLEHIDVETIAARSGSDGEYGYTAPYEAAWQVREEALEPYPERLKCYHGAGRVETCDASALGVLRGLTSFRHSSDVERASWSPDGVGEAFVWILGEWQRLRAGAAARQAMRDGLATFCPGWERGA